MDKHKIVWFYLVILMNLDLTSFNVAWNCSSWGIMSHTWAEMHSRRRFSFWQLRKPILLKIRALIKLFPNWLYSTLSKCHLKSYDSTKQYRQTVLNKVKMICLLCTYPTTEFSISIQPWEEGLFITLKFSHERSRKILKTLRCICREKGLGCVPYICQPPLSTRLQKNTIFYH